MQEPEVRETAAGGPQASKIRLVARSYRAPVRVSAAEDAWWRRVLERIAAVILLVIFAPTMLLVALAIKIESPGGPVFYKQERVGLNRRRGEQPKASSISVRGDRRRNRGEGKPFKIWKFRTMVPDAEKKTGPVWASQDDPRVTRVGNFLRKTRLDELPQLMNVVQGEMRLVGPRPERPHFVERLVEGVPDYRWRLTVPPGITGLAQVERSYDEDLDDVRTKLKYDIFYIENRRPILDFKILLKTLSVVVGRRGAR